VDYFFQEKIIACNFEKKRLILIEACSGFSHRVKNVSFFTFFQLRSSGYAPSKRQKLTKNQPVFATGRDS
jgi:hypothetical protein